MGDTRLADTDGTRNVTEMGPGCVASMVLCALWTQACTTLTKIVETGPSQLLPYMT